jgi:hypothetical protein
MKKYRTILSSLILICFMFTTASSQIEPIPSCRKSTFQCDGFISACSGRGGVNTGIHYSFGYCPSLCVRSSTFTLDCRSTSCIMINYDCGPLVYGVGQGYVSYYCNSCTGEINIDDHPCGSCEANACG